jgi:hypothetical protein
MNDKKKEIEDSEKEVFTTLMFLNELKKQVQFLYSRRLTKENGILKFLLLVIGIAKKI